jgi:hypothetical protein
MQNQICPTGRTIRAGAIAALVLIIVTLACVACVSLSYPVESARYDADSRAYQDAYGKLLRAKSNGRLTHDQDVAVGLIVAEVRAADALTFADLEAWESTGKMPPTYPANVRRLRHAQGELIYLASEVH